ncbi:MAG: hypothetical protein K0Q70_1532 [Rhodospirillales bacterium]|jgi:hypothetical protein|nr:hypothetical protein [Rhodospirillales bacterium]
MSDRQVESASTSYWAEEARTTFAALRDYLHAYFIEHAKKPVSRATRLTDKMMRTACTAFWRKQYESSADMFGLCAEFDNLNEMAFLGAALSCLETDRYRVVRTYVSQARRLHEFYGDGKMLVAYDAILNSLDGIPNLADEDVANRDGADPIYSHPWYRLLAKRLPRRPQLSSQEGFEQFFLEGFLPPAPVIRRGDWIATIGSCFAQHLSSSLANRNGTVIDTPDENHLFVNDSFFTSFVLREAFEYAFGADETRDHWRYGDTRDPSTKTSNPREYAYSVDAVRRALTPGDAYVITLGLSEIWYNKTTGYVYPSGVNITAYDPDVHGFRVSTVEENYENLEAIRRLIRANRGSVPIVFTLSPVPLEATFRQINCVAANSVSKAILRLAIDRLIESNTDDKNLFYFPSYEIVLGYFVDSFMSDMRHVKPNIITFVVDQFYRKFVIEG